LVSTGWFFSPCSTLIQLVFWVWTYTPPTPPHPVSPTYFWIFSPQPHLVLHTYLFLFFVFFLCPHLVSPTYMPTHLFTYLPTHIPMSSTKGIPIYQVIIFPHPSTFLPTSQWSRYLPNPICLVAPTSLVVFPTNLATIENNDERNKMRVLQGIWNYLLKQYLMSQLVFLSTPIWRYCINLKNQECM